MAVMPFLCRGVWFSPKLSYYIIISLAVCNRQTFQIICIAKPMHYHSSQCYHCLFFQFTFSLTEYFRQMRADIESKSAKIQNGNVLYGQVIKKGLPRRYDRLHDNIQIVNNAYGIVLLFEYVFFHLMLLASLYMSISSLINGVKSKSVPWYFFGYTCLVCHHLLRIYQLAAAGELLQNEVKQVLGMLSQFGFMHGDMNILCLTIARKPTESLLTLAGWASLRRSLVGKTLAFVVITMLLIANYKLKEN